MLSVIQDATIQQIMWVEFPASKLKLQLFDVHSAITLAMTGSLGHSNRICLTVTTTENIETFFAHRKKVPQVLGLGTVPSLCECQCVRGRSFVILAFVARAP
jgi:hypothetical protein